MKLIIRYTNKQLIDQTRILDFLKEQMESELFQELRKLKFKKKITIEHLDSKNELRYVWEHTRDKSHPHGNVNIFCSYGSINYGKDDAGSIWCRFGFKDWEFHSWAEGN